MFKIYGGRTEFYQWDANQKLIVPDETITEVHFSNGTTENSLVCSVYEKHGQHLVDVPNVILKDNWNVKVYGFCVDYTKISTTFKVIPRDKPDNYRYEELGLFYWYKEVIENWK